LSDSTAPDWRTGKLCYVEIPAGDVAASSVFYRRAFGWNIRRRDDGAVSFDDTTGHVSGAFVTGRAPAAEAQLVVYIMVADAGAALEALVAAGGEVVRPIDPSSGEIFAWFKDPGGNVLGIYQQPGLAEMEQRTSG